MTNLEIILSIGMYLLVGLITSIKAFSKSYTWEDGWIPYLVIAFWPLAWVARWIETFWIDSWDWD